MTIIKLGGNDIEIADPSFGKIKKLTACFNKLHKESEGQYLSEIGLKHATELLATLLDKTPEEVESMKFALHELPSVIGAVPEICGLVMKVPESGEAHKVTAGI